MSLQLLRKNLVIFSSCISGAKEASQWPVSLEYFGQMCSALVECDTVSFNAALSALPQWLMAVHLIGISWELRHSAAVYSMILVRKWVVLTKQIKTIIQDCNKSCEWLFFQLIEQRVFNFLLLRWVLNDTLPRRRYCDRLCRCNPYWSGFVIHPQNDPKNFTWAKRVL